MIKFYHTSKESNNFLVNSKKLENFLNGISIMCDDVIQDNYYEEYRLFEYKVLQSN